MTLFSFNAHTADGSHEDGTLQAASRDAAMDELAGRNLHVDTLEEIPEPDIADAELAPPATAWSIVDQDVVQPPTPTVTASKTPSSYAPLLDTLRLYAGWLFSWYALIIILGAYQHIRHLPFQIPFAEGLFLSPIILQFTFGSFLFLLLTSLHKALKGGTALLMILLLIGIAFMYVFSLNV